jgi:predicted metal-dependent HD superfamily phosphohydrolase
LLAHTEIVFSCRHAPYEVAPEIDALLVRHYSEPHRAYHNATHITEVLGWFDLVADDVGWQSPRDVYDAILFHDVIYDALAKDNETRSADLALAHGCSPRTAELIALTALHGKLTRAELDQDAALFLDCDTAILGAAPDAFDAYDRGIAIEYASVPPDLYRQGRGAFLRMMRERPRLFLTDYFHIRLDGAARANLQRALERQEPSY